jgi:hypothetical protein
MPDLRLCLAGHVLDLARGDGRGLFGRNGRPRAAESAQQIREWARKGAEDTRSQRRNEFH